MKRMIRKLFPVIIPVAALVVSMTAESAVPSVIAKKKTVLSISLNKKKLSLEINGTYTLKAKVKPAKAKSGVKWKSSAPKIASVTSKGKIKAKSAGKAKITATVRYKKKTKKAVCTVTVTEKNPGRSGQTAAPGQNGTPVQTIAPSQTAAPVQSPVPDQPVQVPVTAIKQEGDININVGETFALKPVIEPATASLSGCTLSSRKDYVASVGADGLITAKYPGATDITIASKANPDVKAVVRVWVGADFTPPEGFNQENDQIAHGKLEDIRYDTPYRMSGFANARLWLPPDYSDQGEYNLLFCLHGGGGNEKYWTDDHGGDNDGCCGDKVLDNLYAAGEMEDTIVVFTSGVITYDKEKEYPGVAKGEFAGKADPDYRLLEFEILNTLLPYMEDFYPVMTGPEHTAMCGLSMGCAQTMETAFKNPDYFGYVGCFSAGPLDEKNQTFITTKETAELLNSKFKLMFFGTGELDTMRDDGMRYFIKNCSGLGLDNVFCEVPGRGHDDLCWDHCLRAFMKYAFKIK